MGTARPVLSRKPGTCLLVTFAISLSLSAQLRPEAPVVSEFHEPFWRVSSPLAVMYLLGSVPYGGKSLLPLPQSVEEAFRNSEILAVESDLREDRTASIQYMFNTYGMLTDETSLSSLLAPEDLEPVARTFNDLGMPFQVLDSYRPWVLWYLYPRLLMDKEQLARLPALDQHFLKHAGSRHVYELEGPELMLRLMAEAPDSQMAQVLAYTIRTHGSCREVEKRLVAQWRLDGTPASPPPQTEAPALEPQAEPASPVPLLLQAYQQRRQTGLLDRLNTLLDHGGTYFVLIDHAFIRGPGGIPASLALQGLQVEALPLFP